MTMIGTLLTHSAVGKPIMTPGSFLKKSSGPPGGQSASAPDNKKRILCCAPSNAACDEIVRRLRGGIPDYHGKSRFVPEVVRLGSKFSVHSDVQDVTLDSLMEERFAQGREFQHFVKNKAVASEREHELKKTVDGLSDKRDMLNARLVDVTDVGEITAKLRECNDQRHQAIKKLSEEKKKRVDSSKSADSAKYRLGGAILKGADVVCCTLSSAGQEKLLSANLVFETVIIDEVGFIFLQ
jgi:superfamily I DNA and/or RNA helicase